MLYTAAVEFLRQDGVELTDEESEELIKYCKLKDLADRSTETSLAGASANVKEVRLRVPSVVEKLIRYCSWTNRSKTWPTRCLMSHAKMTSWLYTSDTTRMRRYVMVNVILCMVHTDYSYSSR